MKLAELLKGIAAVESDIGVTGLALNSSDVEPGYVFLAVAGEAQHGLIFAEQAIEKGAAVIVYELHGGADKLPQQRHNHLYIGVKNLREQLGEIASRFYRQPTRCLHVIGITGTNGKTSCSQFLAQVIPACGVIGTLGWGVPGFLRKTANTTPDALLLQRIMSDFVEQKITSVAMEVSSHGLAQGRVNGIVFSGAVFTNFSRDHLDYHGSMEAYVRAKLTLLQKPELKFVVVNADDAYSEQVIAAVKPGVAIWTFSAAGKNAHRDLCVSAAKVMHSSAGLQFEVFESGQRLAVKAPVFGEFNLENVMAVLTTLRAMGYPLADAAERMSLLQPVAGRMECIKAATDKQPLVFVDYAHTPDALAKVLAALRQHCAGLLWVVFGCGGDRDRGKRAQMGRIAEQWADHIVLTNDNPRSENAQRIIDDIQTGMDNSEALVIADRKQAITWAIEQAGQGDTVLIAGKGHEDYQEINGVRIPFSDTELVKQLLNPCGGHKGYAIN